MVGRAGKESVHAVNLLQQHHEGELMLHGVAPEGQNVVTGLAQGRGVAIRRADEESNVFYRAHLPIFGAFFKLAGGPVFPSLIHGNAQATFAGLQQPG